MLTALNDRMLDPDEVEKMHAAGLDPKSRDDRSMFHQTRTRKPITESEFEALDALNPVALDLQTLAATDPQPPQFKVEGLVPERAATLLASHGGAGKSMLALHMGVCLAAEIPFFGIPTKKSRVLFYSCEDDKPILHWRLHRICRDLGVDLAELDGCLHVYDMTGTEGALFAENAHDPSANLTPRYGWLADRITEKTIDVLIVDNASDAFDANEIQRSKVRRFIQSLVNLVRNHDGAVLLLAHVDKNSAKTKNADGESYSGSTAWHNSVRSRLYLNAEDGDTLTLHHGKLNHGKKSEPITLRWNDTGTLERVEGAGLRDSIGSQHIDAVLGLLREFESRGELIACATNSKVHAYNMLHGEISYPAGLRKNDLFTLLREMERRNLIERTEYRDAYRKLKQRWTVCASAAVVRQ